MPLRVLIDGVPMAEAEGRALWQRFSAWMEEHRGDLGGFACAEGFESVHPELHGGEPVLVASHIAAQRPYTTAVSKQAHATSGAAPARDSRPKARKR
jgi:hypothetical protein